MNKKSSIFILFSIFIFLFIILNISGLVSAVKFETGESAISISLPKGSYQEHVINITSRENTDFDITYTDLSGITINNSSFKLEKGGVKEVVIGFDSSNLEEGDYFGKILIKGGDEGIVIPVIFKVESAQLLFSGEAQVPLKYQYLTPGKDLIAQIKVYDLSASKGGIGLGESPVSLDFKIYDENGTLLSESVENISVNNYLQVSKTISLNNDIPLGLHFLSVDIIYNSAKAGSATTFSVAKDSFLGYVYNFMKNSLYFLVGGLVLAVIIMGLFVLIRIKRANIEN